MHPAWIALRLTHGLLRPLARRALPGGRLTGHFVAPGLPPLRLTIATPWVGRAPCLPVRALLIVAALASVPAALHAQTLPVSGYVQTVPLGGTAGGAVSDFNRFRLSTTPDVGPLRFEAAYEHVLTLQRTASLPAFNLAAVPGGGEWLDLQWTLTEREHVVWRHRFDRFNVGFAPTDNLEVVAGRQAVSWGTALFLTPSDPFSPFNPVDPFREFRAGVDAARIRYYPGPLSEVDVVVRQTRSPAGAETTALARGLTTVANWELSGWGGTLYGDPAAAFGSAGSLGPWAVRGEGVLRRMAAATVFRGTIGIDRQLQAGGRDLTLAAEYQRDGLGAAGPDELAQLLVSETFLRGEHQVLGRDEAVVQASYQLHPLWSVSGLWLWNLNDRSAILGPSLAYSATDNSAIAAGVFVGVGNDEETADRPLPSEYGLAGVTGFISFNWYF